MPLVSLLTMETYLEQYEVYMFVCFFPPCDSFETLQNPIALHEPEMLLTAKSTTIKPSVLCGAYIEKCELWQVYCKAW